MHEVLLMLDFRCQFLLCLLEALKMGVPLLFDCWYLHPLYMFKQHDFGLCQFALPHIISMPSSGEGRGQKSWSNMQFGYSPRAA